MVNRRPTIADVAERARVSKGAVSLVVNDRPGLTEQTRARILAAVDELGWQPSQRARALSYSRAFSLGFVVARDPALLRSDPFFPAFIAGVESVLAQQGQVLVLQVVGTAQDEVAGYRRLVRDSRVDGFLLSDLRRDDPRIPLLKELGQLAVTLNRPVQESGFPAVCLDDRPGIAASVEHLAQLGHTRIAHVAGPIDFMHAQARREAFLETLERLGIPPGPVVVADFTAAGGVAATRRLLADPEPPTAIVYANDVMAIAGISAAAELGVRVPHQLSVTGYDDTELAEFVHPALTTVRADPFRWGEIAARTLLDLVEGGRPADVQLEPARLVVRRSTAAPGSRPHT
ncbi:LacI family DNA-binding transcriptional regulator [Fodinicola feengrottensis]|uniref:LacI family DNA-binding transcriptional regulator n=1 Tax=Fodinicola feengrottensis TaxID=435914 RepID=A0ABN2JAU0_9ACTN